MLENSLQLVKVIADAADDIHARLGCFTRDKVNAEWQSVGLSFPVVIGKNGLANEGEKKEGDHKSPSGVFPLISAYGYSAVQDAQWIHLPYMQCTPSLKCVDDVSSSFYNKIVNENEVKKDWNSAEDMLRKDNLYKWGIVVGYNTVDIIPGAGSAIFMHIWRSANEGTEGCIATEQQNIIRLLKWLEERKKPMVSIQA